MNTFEYVVLQNPDDDPAEFMLSNIIHGSSSANAAENAAASAAEEGRIDISKLNHIDSPINAYVALKPADQEGFSNDNYEVFNVELHYQLEIEVERHTT